MFGRRNGYAEAQEGLKALEVRLSRLAEEVHALAERQKLWEVTEPARLAAIHEATDKLKRVTERARKAGELGPDRESEGDDRDFWDTYESRRRIQGAP